LAAELNIAIAFTGGLVSFFSPCILPLVPAFFASLVGQIHSLEHKQNQSSFLPRRKLLALTLAFILGFSLVFILMGLSLGFVGSFFLLHRILLTRFGGAIVMALGLQQLGLFKLPFLQRSLTFKPKVEATKNFAGLFLLGIIFSLGWSPCVGPILAGILLMGMGAGDPYTAALYLFAYSMGMALPFLVISFFLDSFLERRRELMGYLPLFSRISAVLLIFLGIILISGLFLSISAVFS